MCERRQWKTRALDILHEFPLQTRCLGRGMSTEMQPCWQKLIWRPDAWRPIHATVAFCSVFNWKKNLINLKQYKIRHIFSNSRLCPEFIKSSKQRWWWFLWNITCYSISWYKIISAIVPQMHFENMKAKTWDFSFYFVCTQRITCVATICISSLFQLKLFHWTWQTCVTIAFTN